MGRRKQNESEMLTNIEKFCLDAYLLNGDVDQPIPSAAGLGLRPAAK